ncbi:hypothetical protein D9M68_321250 [compost metagenome]
MEDLVSDAVERVESAEAFLGVFFATSLEHSPFEGDLLLDFFAADCRQLVEDARFYGLTIVG